MVSLVGCLCVARGSWFSENTVGMLVEEGARLRLGVMARSGARSVFASFSEEAVSSVLLHRDLLSVL